MKTRKEIADELMTGCPDGLISDHRIVAEAITRGDSPEKILAMPELNNWPDSYSWVKSELE